MPIGPALSTAFQAAKGGLKSTGSAIGKPFDTLQSLGSGMRGRDILKNPAIGIPAAFFAFGPDQFGEQLVVDPIRDAAKYDPFDQALVRSQEVYKQKRHALLQRAEVEDLQRKAMRASMRLAALDPHLYNEVMAGRSLPKDAVVFGGQPRQDLMEQLAMSMAEGQFKEQPSASDELMQELGV